MTQAMKVKMSIWRYPFDKKERNKSTQNERIITR
jgi:hypothetical protein